jgi:hypothetical protein
MTKQDRLYRLRLDFQDNQARTDKTADRRAGELQGENLPWRIDALDPEPEQRPALADDAHRGILALDSSARQGVMQVLTVPGELSGRGEFRRRGTKECQGGIQGRQVADREPDR